MSISTNSASDLENLRTEARAWLELPGPAVCKEARTKAGVSRARLASRVGVSEGSIGFYERGLRRPRGEHLIRYVEAINALREEAGV